LISAANRITAGGMSTLKVLTGMLLTLSFSMAGQALLRVGVTRRVAAAGVAIDELFRHHLLSLIFSPLVVAGCALSGVGVICWMYVLAHFELSRALPLLGGLGYLALFAIGRLWLGERTTLSQFGGLLLLLVGMYFINQKAN
jgi:multidrug transporter EmrE-like cation transporter